MPNLTQVIEVLQAEAATSCTQCLIDHVHEETGELNEKLATLAAAAMQRGSIRDGEARYVEAFTDVVQAVLMVAIYTAELYNHRSVDWRETGHGGTVTISPN